MQTRAVLVIWPTCPDKKKKKKEEEKLELSWWSDLPGQKKKRGGGGGGGGERVHWISLKKMNNASEILSSAYLQQNIT